MIERPTGSAIPSADIEALAAAVADAFPKLSDAEQRVSLELGEPCQRALELVQRVEPARRRRSGT